MKDIFTIGGANIELGTIVDLKLPVSETYTGDVIGMPVKVIRGPQPGPAVFVTAAIHGDEINGTGIIHDLMFNDALDLVCGTLVLVPVVNVLGFENQDRYLPDRRDLNRSFPGNAKGSMASRLANTLMKDIVSKCDYGIDLHSAASQRTNYPNVRADMADERVAQLARFFECSLIVNGKGPAGAFRREACRKGCPTIILEAGEVWKIEPGILRIGVTGVRNALIQLGMLAGTVEKPPYQVVIHKTTWIRAEVGGILKFHISAGQIVAKGQSLATNYSILGEVQNIIKSTADGIVLGMATMPAVKPGEPVCHLAIPEGGIDAIRKKTKKSVTNDDIFNQVKIDLATNIDVVRP